MHNKGAISRLAQVCALTCAALVATAGCSIGTQVESLSERTPIDLARGDLEQYGVGFLTPSAATGREADKQALAMSFAVKLEEMHPEIWVVSLPNVLSEVNAADLDLQYKDMYRDYLQTGILEGSTLKRISDEVGVRYFVQLSLSSFQQSSSKRFGFFGLRLTQTEIATIRVFAQIWDGQKAEIVWEGFTELSYAYDTGAERPVNFAVVAEVAAEELFTGLPCAKGRSSDDEDDEEGREMTDASVSGNSTSIRC